MQRTIATLGLIASVVLAACGGATNTGAGTSPAASAAGSAAASAAPASLTIMVGGLNKQIYLPNKLTEALGYFKDQNLTVNLIDAVPQPPRYPPTSRYYNVPTATWTSPDGRQVVAVAKDREGKQHLWLAALDRQSAPRQIPGVEGNAPFFGQGAEVFFSKVDGASRYLYRVLDDGTGLRSLSEQPIFLSLGVSPDGRWVVVSVPSAIVALPVKGGVSVPIISDTACVGCHMAWSPDGGLLFISMPTAASASHVVGRTYIIPLSRGQMFPTIPPGGFRSESELAKLPGVRIVDAFDCTPGPTPEVYAFSRATVQRNLYRIPIP